MKTKKARKPVRRNLKKIREEIDAMVNKAMWVAKGGDFCSVTEAGHQLKNNARFLKLIGIKRGAEYMETFDKVRAEVRKSMDRMGGAVIRGSLD